MASFDELHRSAAPHFAAAARQDFHTFVEYVGIDARGEPLVQRPIDHLLWQFVEETHARGQPAGVLLPVTFGKTTQVQYRVAWEIGRDPNTLAAFVSDAVDTATVRVEMIRDILDRPAYREVFPKVRVVRGKDERERFTVARKGLSKDATCSAWGVFAGAGLRANLLVLDDVVTQRNAILEPTNRRRVEEMIRLTWTSRPMIGGDGRVIWIQTAYHMADASARLREDPQSGWRWLVVRAEDPYDILKYEIWERGFIVGEGKVACPFAAEDVAERARRMGPTAAARALANRPVSDEECPFREQYFQGPTPLPAEQYTRRIGFADPAGDASKLKTGDTDYCAFVAIGLNKDKTWEVYLAERMRGTPLQQANFIARKIAQAKVQVAFQEAVKDEALVAVTQAEMKKFGCYLGLKPVKPSMNKELRIVQTLEPALAASPPVLRICGRTFPALREEALSFPVGAHDDLLDALAGAYANIKATAGGRIRVWADVPPERRAQMEAEARENHQKWERERLERRRQEWRERNPGSVFGPPF